LVLLVLVDEDLPVVAQDDLVPLERPRRGTLEVDPRRVEAAAVTRALELVLGREPVRRAAEVRAGRRKGVEPLVGPHEPGAVRLLPPPVDLADGVVAREAGLEALHRLEEDVREHEARRRGEAGAHGAGEGDPADAERGDEAPARDAVRLRSRRSRGLVRLRW